MSVAAATRRRVRRRAGDACEFCGVPQWASEVTLQVEHVQPRQHGGGNEETNLALACPPCNRHKGPNLTGIDPLTKQIVVLFNPRVQAWGEHFALHNLTLVGLTPIGRATVAVLQLNSPAHLLVRQAVVLGT